MSVRRLLLAFTICVVASIAACAKAAPKAGPPAAAAATSGAPAAAAATAPARAAAGAAAATSVARLQQELAAAFDNPSVSALWAVQVQSFDTGEVLFERNAHTLVIPASNMKLVTMSVAAARLGWDFRFATQIATNGTIAKGTLTGDLIVIGNGDPTISDRGGDPTRVFQAWADQLRGLGITRIAGRIVGDDDWFDDQALGDGWAWDDLVYGYSTAAGALQFNEDSVKAIIHPAATAGQLATVTLEPAGSGLTLRNFVITGATATTADISLVRRPGSTVLEISGTVPLGGKDVTQTAAVENPTQFYVNVLRDVLVRKGITVDGAAVDIDDVKPGVANTAGVAGAAAPAAPAAAVGMANTASAAIDPALALDKRRVLFTHQSPPLASEEVATTFMKVSQNLFGETLMLTIGALAQTPASPAPSGATATATTSATAAAAPAATAPGSADVGSAAMRHHHADAARKVYEEVLSGWGVPPGEHMIVDGSGLSRYDYITANMIVRILRAMAREPKYAATFEALLPIAGKDGTLRNRMKGTKAEGNVHAKTGTLSSVRSLSGYLRTADGERIGFSIIANNFKAPSATIDGIAELAVERLSNFTRATH
jgi:D-alanyl-D-alanine carboxypeptidase/D-alanyl-D-alanine-endopeptidase (penicillin-binding protein 4)